MAESARGTYTDWHWPAPPVSSDGRAGYSSFEHVLLIETDPGPESAYFWAHQFVLLGGTGGYLGLQTRGSAEGVTGRIAIFSIWDAVAALGSTTVRFTGEGEGWSCRIAYPWEVGRRYRLRLANPEPGWWVASVRDDTTGVGAEIGRIQVPPHWQRLDSWSVMWTEWYGQPLVRCEDLPHASVVFHTPAADDGRVSPQRCDDHLATGSTCDNSRLERLPEGSRQRMGVPPGPP